MGSFDKTLEAIAQIDRSETPESLMESLLTLTARWGLDQIVAGTMPTGREPRSALKKHFLLSGFPAPWLERYISGRYAEKDPIIRRITRNPTPFIWSDLDRDGMVGTGRKIMNEAAEFRLRDGFAVPLWTSDCIAAVSLGGERVEISPAERGMATIVSTYAMTKAMSLRNLYEERSRSVLTPREIECLKWVAAGKNEWEIAQILSISEHTADRHLANVHRKLGVYTRPHAVAQAFRMGIIN